MSVNKLSGVVRTSRKIFASILAGTAIAAIAASASAAAAPSSCASADTLLDILGAKPGEAQVIDIQPLPNLPEVCSYVLQAGAQKNVFFGSEKYIIAGQVIDLEAENVVNEAILEKYSMIDMASYAELKSLATFTIGSGADDVILLTDPECPFCKKLEKALSGTESDVTYHVVLLPLSSHKYGTATAKMLTCDENAPTFDTLGAFANFSEAQEGYAKTLKAESCEEYDNNIAAITQLLRSQGVDGGIPKTFYANGSFISGAVPTQKIMRKIADVKK